LSALPVHILDETCLIIGKKLGACCTSKAILILYDANFTPRFLYILYIAVDANFKLKGKERGLKDVELMPGWAYFVREDDFQAHIAKNVDQPEVCVFPSGLKLASY
jgi:hypothetical protein